MSDLLKSKTQEFQALLSQAAKEEKELEALNQQLAQLSQKVATLTESSREKRVFAESLEAAAKRLGGVAEVVEITTAKKGKAAKAAKPAAAAVAAPEAAAPAKKEGKKAGKAKTAKTAEKTAAPAKPAAAPKKTKTAAQADKSSRVAGDRPPLHERLRIVLAEDQVTIPQAIERLRARDANWLPDSTDLNAYISLALSTHKETFERVSRGVYQVRKGAVPAAIKPVKKAVTAQKTNGAHNPSNGAGIEDLGNNIKDNPFTDTVAA